MNGIGRGRGWGGGRAIEKMDVDSVTSFETADDLSVNPIEMEDRPLRFTMGHSGCIGRGVGKNLTPEVAEMVMKVQLELFDRQYYLKHYRPNSPHDVQGQAKLATRKLSQPPPPPKEEENDDNEAGEMAPHFQPRALMFCDGDSEVENLKDYLSRKKLDQRNWERVRHERMRRMKQAPNAMEVDSDNEDVSEKEDMDRKLETRVKLLKMRKKMRKEAKDDDEDEGKVVKRRRLSYRDK